MREFVFKVAFWTLLLLTICVFGCGPIFGQEVIRVDVSPQVAIAHPYKHQTFHFRYRVERNVNNRILALYYSCGKELNSSQTQIDENSPVTYDRYPELTVLDDCYFQACVVRVEKGKAVTICDHKEVRVN